MTVPKIPADGFMIFAGYNGFSIGVQQAEFPAKPTEGSQEIPLATVQEIRVSPHTAKALLQALAVNVRKYEDEFGEIKVMASFYNRAAQ